MLRKACSSRGKRFFIRTGVGSEHVKQVHVVAAMVAVALSAAALAQSGRVNLRSIVQEAERQGALCATYVGHCTNAKIEFGRAAQEAQRVGRRGEAVFFRRRSSEYAQMEKQAMMAAQQALQMQQAQQAQQQTQTSRSTAVDTRVASSSSPLSGSSAEKRCLSLDRARRAGNVIGVKNACNYPVHFVFCWRTPSPDSLASFLTCSKGQFGAAEVKARSWTGITAAASGKVEFGACRSPSFPADTRFDGDKITGRCSGGLKPRMSIPPVAQSRPNIAPRQGQPTAANCQAVIQNYYAWYRRNGLHTGEGRVCKSEASREMEAYAQCSAYTSPATHPQDIGGVSTKVC